MLTALTAALSGITAAERCFYAISVATYITINLGSHTHYIRIYKEDGYPHFMPNAGDLMAVTLLNKGLPSSPFGSVYTKEQVWFWSSSDLLGNTI